LNFVVTGENSPVQKNPKSGYLCIIQPSQHQQGTSR
jgi:hypothetical protein